MSGLRGVTAGTVTASATQRHGPSQQEDHDGSVIKSAFERHRPSPFIVR